MRMALDGVYFGYDERSVLEAVSLIVESEFVGIVGPNGCGKTTLLKLLARILEPKKGAVLVDGSDIDALSAKELGRRLSLLPQNSTITFAFTALDIVLMGRNPHLERLQSPSREDLDIAGEAMRMTRTWELRDRVVTELSGGEKQKVLIARALAQRPGMFLLDEPTSHLDIGAQLEVLELIKGLNGGLGIGVVAVFHDLNMAARYCSRLFLIHRGSIICQGSPEEVLTPENVSKAYGVEVKVERKPETGCIQLLPLRALRGAGGASDRVPEKRREPR